MDVDVFMNEEMIFLKKYDYTKQISPWGQIMPLWLSF